MAYLGEQIRLAFWGKRKFQVNPEFSIQTTQGRTAKRKKRKA